MFFFSNDDEFRNSLAEFLREVGIDPVVHFYGTPG